MLWVLGYVVMGVVGVSAIIWGANGVRLGRIKFGREQYEGTRARTVGFEVILIGVFFIGLLVAAVLLLR